MPTEATEALLKIHLKYSIISELIFPDKSSQYSMFFRNGGALNVLLPGSAVTADSPKTLNIPFSLKKISSISLTLIYCLNAYENKFSYLYREYGYSLRGQKVYDKISGKKFQRTSIVAAEPDSKIIAPMQYSQTMNSALFEMWFEKCLLPYLEEGTVIVMDNASFHRKKQLFKICEKYGFNLIFLPPYSPELNPIERYWFVLKHRIKSFLRINVSLDDAIRYFFRYSHYSVFK